MLDFRSSQQPITLPDPVVLDVVDPDHPSLDPTPFKVPQSPGKRIFFIATAIALSAGLLAAASLIITRNQQQLAVNQKDTYATTAIPLTDVTPESILSLGQVGKLDVNGRVQVNGALVLTPQELPTNPTTGQLYYDKTSNQVYYYNGSQFSQIATDTSVVASLGGTTGNIALGPGLTIANGTLSASINPETLTGGVTSLQGQKGNITLTQGNGINITGTTISNSGVTRIGNVAGALTVGNGIGLNGSELFSNVQVVSNEGLQVIPTSTGYEINWLGAGAGGTVALAPGSAQTDSSNNTSININKTGATGGLITLGVLGTPTFVVSETGEITAGSIDYARPGAIINKPSLGVTSLEAVTGAVSLGAGINLGLGNVLSVSAPTTGNYIADVLNPNSLGYQLANLKVQSKNSAYVTADISGTTGQSADILQVRADGSDLAAADLFSISAAGVATFQPAANSNQSFRVYNSAATPDVSIPIFNVNTANNRVGINVANPGYALDVLGTINSRGTIRINEVAVCTQTGCLAPGDGSNYVAKSTTVIPSSFALLTADDNAPTITLQATSGQATNSQNLINFYGKGASILGFDTNGNINYSGGGAFKTNLIFATPTSLTTISVPTSGVSGSSTVCLLNALPGNPGYCTGSGGGGVGGTGNGGNVPYFISGINVLGDATALISQTTSPNTAVINGILSVEDSAGVTIGIPGPVGGVNGVLKFANITNANLVTLSPFSGANAPSGALTFRLPSPASPGTFTIGVGIENTLGTNPLQFNQTTGTISCPTCKTSGGGGGGGVGVVSVNGLTGDLFFDDTDYNGGIGKIVVRDATIAAQKGIAYFDIDNFTVTSGLVNTVQNINSTATPTFAKLTLQGGGDSLSLGTAGPAGASGGIDFYNATNSNKITLGFDSISPVVPGTNISLYLPSSGGTLVSSAAGPLTVSAAGQLSLGTVDVTKGGTGRTTVGLNELLFGSGGNSLSVLAAPVSAGVCLTTNGSSNLIWGSCAGSAGNGVTLNGAYLNFATNPAYIDLDGTKGGIIIRDNASPITGDLFRVQSNSLTNINYFSVTPASTTVNNTLRLSGLGNGVLRATVTTGVVTSGTVSLSGADVTGVLPVSLGGTGIGSPFAVGDLLYASGVGTVSTRSIGASPQGSCLVTSGSLPVWGSCAGGSAGGLTLQSAYNNSTVDADKISLGANGGVLVRDASGANGIGSGATLFAVQNNDGSVQYLRVVGTGATPGVFVNNNLTIQGAGALSAISASFTGGSSLTVGADESQTGSIAFYSQAGGSGATTLRARNTGEGKDATLRVLTLPDFSDGSETYTLCVGVGAGQESDCGLAGAAGSYIQNRSASTEPSQTTSNFYISGTGRAATAFVSNTFDTAVGGGTLNVGGNASLIVLQDATNVAGDVTYTSTGAAGTRQLSVQTQTTLNTAGDALTVASAQGNGTGAGGVLTVRSGAGGTTGNGGALSLQAGVGGSTSGNGGSTTLAAGNATTSGAGGSLSLTAGNGAGTNQNGGNITITAGAKTGSGTAGTVTIKPAAASDSTNFFQVQNAAGTAIVNVNTTAGNERLSVGTAGTATGQLYVGGVLPGGALGSVGTGTNPYASAAQGRYIYLVNQATESLQILDVSNPSNPVSVNGATGQTTGVGSGPIAIAVSGKYAYVINATTTTLKVFDVSNPANVVEVGSSLTNAAPSSIAVYGSYVYVGTSGSLQVFNVSNPTSPTSPYWYPLGGGISATSIATYGKYAYITRSDNALQIFDLSNPLAPAPVNGAGTTTSTTPKSVIVVGRYAYIANNGANNFQIFDISNPAVPVVMNGIGGTGTTGAPNKIIIFGRYVVLASASTSTLQIFDVSYPSVPIGVGSPLSTGVGSFPFDLTLTGRYLGVIGFISNNFQIFDLGGTYTSTLESGTLETTTARINNDASIGGSLSLQGGLTVAGSTLLDGNVGINGSVRANDTALFQNKTNTANAFGVAQAGAAAGTNVFNVDTTGTGSVTVQSAGSTTAFRVQTSAGNPVLNVDTTNSRVSVGNLGTQTGQLYVGGVLPTAALATIPALNSNNTTAVVGRYAYTLPNGTNTLQIFDISNPSSPVSVNGGGTATISNPTRITVYGKYAYIIDSGSPAGKLQIFDISNPASPVVQNGAGTATGETPVSIIAQGRYVYIGNNNSQNFQIFDVSNPANPTIVNGAGTSIGTYVQGMFMKGNILYITGGGAPGWLSIYDVSNPAAPSVLNSGYGLTTASIPGKIYVDGNYAYITMNNGDLKVYNISVPASVTLTLNSVGATSGSAGVNVSGRYLYLSGSNGIKIFDKSNPASLATVGTITSTGATSVSVFGRYALSSNGQIFDMGGTYTSSLETGALTATTARINNDINVGTNLSLQGGLSVAGSTQLGATTITGNLQVNNSALFKNATNSTTAFSIQNSSSVSLLNVDTTNSRVSVGSLGTATGQLYVDGGVTSIAHTLSLGAGGITGLASQGRYVYAVGNNSLLQTIDVSRPGLMAQIGSGVSTGSQGARVAVSGSYAYVTLPNANELRIFNISNPAVPVLVKTVTGFSTPDGLDVYGGRYVFVANSGSTTVSIVDTRDPANASIISTLTSLTNPRGVRVFGNYAYVANTGANQIKAYDISNIISPTPLGSQTTGSSPRALEIVGRYAYISNYSAGTLQTFDISNPSSIPAALGSTSAAALSAPDNIAVAGRYAYVRTPSGSSSMTIVNIANPASLSTIPSVTGLANTAPGNSIIVSGRYAYVTNSASITSIDLGGTYSQTLESGSIETTSLRANGDISTGGNLAIQGGLSVAGASLFDGNVAINGSAVLKNKVNSTTALDIQNATGTTVANVDTTNSRLSVGTLGTVTGQLYVSGSLPTAQTGSTGTQTSPNAIATQGRYSYVVSTANKFQVFDTSNPAAPASLNGTGLTVSAGVNAVSVSGRYAYVVSNPTKMQIIDISDPTNPTLMNGTGTAVAGGTPISIVVSGNYAYIGTQSSATLQVYNVSNPANPTQAGSASTSGPVESISISGSYAYTVESSTNVVRIYNISNPAAPAITNTSGAATGTSPQSIVVSGRYAYVANNGSNSMQAFDISNPATTAAAIATFSTSINAPTSVFVAGRYVYITNSGTDTLQVVDISTPTAPVNVGTITTGDNPQQVIVGGRYAYVINGNTANTLQIFDLGGTYTQTLESGTIETTTFRASNDASVGGSLSLQGGLTVAGASLLDGDLTVNGAAIFKNKTNSTTALQIQNASGTSFFTADSTNLKVTVTGTLEVTNSIIVKGRITTGNIGATVTTAAAGAAACTTPPVPTITGNDIAGVITITTGTGCAATGTLATVTFGTAYPTTAPKVVITAQDGASEGLQTYATQSLTNFIIGTNTAPADGLTYKYSYFVVQ